MKLRGFTIVELLIVIVVIAIIAAISIVAYTGTTQKAILSSIQADLTYAKKQLLNFQASSATNSFPTAINCTNPNSTEICLRPSGSNIFLYNVNNSSNLPNFNLTVTNGSNKYWINNGSGILTSPDIVKSGLRLNIDAADPASYSGSGASVTDLTGLNASINSYDASLFFSDNSLDFTASNTDGLNLAGNNFAGLTDYTMEAVFKVSGTHLHYSGALISSGDWNNNHWSFGLYQDNGSLYLRNMGSLSANNVFYHSFAINTWYQVVIVRSGTTLSAFVNNVKKTDQTVTGAALASGATNTAIGRETYANGYFNLNGRIAIARIYNRALSDAEVSQNYTALRSRYGI